MPVQATIDIGGNFGPLRADAGRAFADIQKNFKTLGQGPNGLGTISRDFDAFDRSLKASNSRVIAFGLSASIILGFTRSFANMVKQTVEVDKALRDVNVILQLSNKNFQAFGSQLFDIARITGRPFKDIAEGAVSLSRAGLGATETLKRLKDAATLARLSGLDLNQSVETITASINSFSKSVLDSTTLVSKFAAVDAAFSVSSKDLAESIKRVGSASEDVGVDINNLLGLITSARQLTGREGPVIAQALNSVFSRISRPETIEDLRNLGVEINNTQNGVQKLQALSKALETANEDTANLIRFEAGGVRNLNVLSAVLKDVNNEYGVYARAAKTAANASNEAQLRNEELNKSFSTLINKTGVNLVQFSSQLGNLTIGPALEKSLNGINSILEGAFSKNSDSLGEVVGKGLLKGLGEAISGPGLALILITVGKLAATLAIEAGQGLKSILGLNDAAKQRAAIELSVNSILKEQPTWIALATQSEKGLLNVVSLVNAKLRERALITPQQAVATAVTTKIIRGTNGVRPNFADTSEIPNFASISPFKDLFKELARQNIKIYRNQPRAAAGEGAISLPHKGLRQAYLEDGKEVYRHPLFLLSHEAGHTLGKNFTNPNVIGSQLTAERGANTFAYNFLKSRGANEEILKKYADFAKLQYSTYAGDKKPFLTGEFPNFSPLSAAISREKASGLNLSQIKIGKSPALASSSNPLGLGVYNTRDEPGGINQGINRAFREGRNPKTYGVPNFAEPFTTRQAISDLERNRLNQTAAQIARDYSNGAKSYKETIDAVKKAGDEFKLSGKGIKQLNEVVLSSKSKISSFFQETQKSTSQVYNYFGNKQNKPSVFDYRSLLPGAIFGSQPTQPFQSPQRAAIGNGRQPLLLGYNLPPSNPATQGTQLGFPGFGSQDLINQQAQLNLYRDQALQRQANIQNVLKKYREKVYNDRLAAQKNIPPISNNRFGDFFNSPRGQNLALASSFILPIAAGGIAETIGNRTIGQRGAGQTVQSLANIGSYTALGASFGPQGAAVGVGLGALLETPRIIKAFTDKIPDLDREIERLTELINATNDGFGAIIQTNEKLNAFAKGELTLTAQQFLQQKQLVNTSLVSLAGKNPNFASEIGNVFANGNQSQQSELLGRIQSKNLIQKTREELQKSGELISPSLGNAGLGFYKNTTSQLFSLFNIFGNKDRLFNQKTGNFNPFIGFQAGNKPLDKDAQQNLKDLTRGTLFQTNEDGKSIASYLVEKFRNNSDDRDVIAIGKAIQDLTRDSSQGNRDKLLSRLEKAAGNIGNIDISAFQRILLSVGDQAVQVIAAELQSDIGPRTIKGLGSFKAPDQIKAIRDAGNILRPIQELFSNINQIGSSFQARGQENINSIENRLSRQTSNISTDADIRSGRLVGSSALGALDIQFQATQKNINLQRRAELNKLDTSLDISDRGSILKFLNGLQKQAFSEKDSTKLENRLKNFDAILQRLLPKSNINASGPLGDAISVLSGDTRKEFFQNISKELDSNTKQLSTFQGEVGSLGYAELQNYQESLLELLQDEFDITLDFNTKRKDILEKIKNAQEQNLHQDRLKREQIVQGIVQQYSSIVGDVNKFSDDIRNILESNKRLTGFRSIRANELDVSRRVLREERDNYRAGDIASRDLRPYVSDTASKQLRNDGSISRESLNDIFKSSFGYNKQDFGQDLISDMEGIRDALTSIRPAAKDAFASMVDGSKSAGDAFRDFGASMATNVLNNVAKLAFDNVFGNLFNNNTFGAIGNLFSAKSKGGIVGYASGGMVTGGSGIRDDVPAMLANGAYVIKKSSVNKYGSGFLSSLNSGRGFASGGINQILRNDFSITGRKQGIRGSFDIDPRLSVIGQTDENNPSNLSKFGREQDYYGYLNTIEDYKRAVKQFEAAKTQRLIGAYTSGIINIGAYGLSNINKPTFKGVGKGVDASGFQNTYSNFAALGGLSTLSGIKRYSSGGRTDSIPALLTGGEFVMSPQAVNRMGVGFMNRLNGGQITPSRYASGGFVGRDINAASPVSQDNSDWGQINSSLLELIKLNQEIRDLSNGTKSKVDNKNAQNNTDNSTAISPSVSIVINMMGDKTNTQTKSNNTEDSNNNGQNLKQFAEMMKNVALSTIFEQQRPGGTLQGTIRK